MITGTLVLRYAPHYGWQVFDCKPRYLMNPNRACVTLYRADPVKGQGPLLRITGSFLKSFRRGEIIKAPHKLMYWPSKHKEPGYLVPAYHSPTNEVLEQMMADLNRDLLRKIIQCPKHDTGGGPCYCSGSIYRPIEVQYA